MKMYLDFFIKFDLIFLCLNQPKSHTSKTLSTFGSFRGMSPGGNKLVPNLQQWLHHCLWFSIVFLLKKNLLSQDNLIQRRSSKSQ